MPLHMYCILPALLYCFFPQLQSNSIMSLTFILLSSLYHQPECWDLTTFTPSDWPDISGADAPAYVLHSPSITLLFLPMVTEQFNNVSDIHIAQFSISPIRVLRFNYFPMVQLARYFRGGWPCICTASCQCFFYFLFAWLQSNWIISLALTL